MATRISINGAIGDATIGDGATATISVLDRGFLYGDSVYEVLRTYGGEPFALDEHIDRLERSARLLEIALPIGRDALISEIRATMAAAANSECYVRIIITRGAGPIGLDPALAVDPTRVIIVTGLETLADSLYTEGVRVALVGAGIATGEAVPVGAKSGNYLTNLLALRRARQRGAHEALMLDARGRICEGSSSNVFAVFGRQDDPPATIATPPLDVGILEGITRRKVMALARRLGYRVEQRELVADDLRAAHEVFITSTIREVLPVVGVDDWVVGAGRPGEVTKHLHREFPRDGG